MKRLYKIAHVLECYLIIVASVSFISTYKIGLWNALLLAFLLFLGPLVIILFPTMIIFHIVILYEKYNFIFEENPVPKNKEYIINIFCILGSLSIIYLISLFFVVVSAI